MPSYYWIKLWIDTLNDPKMGTLPDRLWRRAIELFLVARTGTGDGYLPDLEDVAWSLRLSSKELIEDLMALEDRTGIVQLREGGWYVTNFAKRQATISDKERQRRKRGRDKEESRNSHAPVTSCNLEAEAEAEADEQTTEAEEDEQQTTDSAAAVQAMQAHGMTGAETVLRETDLTPAQLIDTVRYAEANDLGAGWVRSEVRENRAHSPPPAETGYGHLLGDHLCHQCGARPCMCERPVEVNA